MATFRSLIASAAALAASMAAAEAATMSFTDRASFEAAAGTLETEDFSGQTVGALPESTVNGGFNGFTVNWVNEGGSNMGVGIDDPGLDKRLAWGEDLFFNGSGQVGPTITLEFEAPIFALGFDWFDEDPTDSYSLTVAGETFTNGPFLTSDDGFGFFGIISDVAFDSVVFTSTTQGGFVRPFGVDNLAFQEDVSEVPLPAGLPLLLTGIAGLGFAGCRKGDRASA